MTAPTQYIIGTQIQLNSTFQDAFGNLVDPSTVTATILTPDGVETDISGSVIRQSQGVYAADFTPVQRGLHQFRFAGSGAVIAANEGNFIAQTDF